MCERVRWCASKCACAVVFLLLCTSDVCACEYACIIIISLKPLARVCIYVCMSIISPYQLRRWLRLNDDERKAALASEIDSLVCPRAHSTAASTGKAASFLNNFSLILTDAKAR